MRCSKWSGTLGACLLSWAVLAPAQVLPPIPAPRPGLPPYRLGLIDSRATEIEVIPGVRLGGLEVLGVIPGSPAGRAGLGAGDVILAANSVRVIASNDLRRAMTESGGWLRLKVFEARTEQVLNVTVALRPGVGPTPITVIGRLNVGAAAIGGETTGITLTSTDGQSYDLDFGAVRPPDRGADGRVAVVSGVLRVSPGPERRARRIIQVSHFRLVGGVRPRTERDPRGNPF